MELILLPGLDGTGDLFAPILSELKDIDHTVIALPQNGNQSYHSLTEHVQKQLPKKDFVLLAESFSGPIAASIVQQKLPDLKGIIFAATFLSPPIPFLSSISKRLSVHFLIKLPGSKFVLKKLMFGPSVKKETLKLFKSSLNSVFPITLKSRLNAIQNLQMNHFESQIPAIYILPDKDRLVPKNKVLDFEFRFSQFEVKRVNGPHFVLQTAPEKTAEIVREFLKTVTPH